MDEVWFWPLLLGVLGLVFGSFIATVALRWPQGRSALQGRSECDSCGKTLGADELVPVASFLLQRGKCRSCGARIPRGHLIVELIALGIGLAAGFAAPGIEGAAGAVFGWLLLALAALDFVALWLPNILNAALAVAGIATGLLGVWPPLDERLIGGLGGFAALWTVAAIYRGLRGRDGLGGGDPKLFGAIGLWLGWRPLPAVLLVACVIGLTMVLVLRLRGRRMLAADRLPLGVMLAAAAWGLWLGGKVVPPPTIPVIVEVGPETMT